MNNFLYSFSIVVYICSMVIADPIDGYWQQKVDYDMEITLHDSVRQISGTTIIKYTNNSPDSLDRIYMHLYPNAFQLESVKYREYVGHSGRVSRAKYFKEKLEGHTSKIEIHEFNIAKKKKPVLKDYLIDDTILKAMLSRKLGPGETMRVDLKWTHHVGGMVERAGYYQGQYNMAQWYPKVVVYDEKGWHADVFHAEGEFYGEFGDFNVEFDIPAIFIIGASGTVTSGDPGWESVKVDTSRDYTEWIEQFDSTFVEPDSTERRIVSFYAENVHDFAWVAGPDLLYEYGKWQDIDIHVLYNKINGKKWTRDVLKRSFRAMAWLDEKFGDYLYPQVTITDRLKSGGMEYPMLVMNGRDSEGLIVHEIGHIYFYGILANNEVDEAWLDEGFTTTQTMHYMMNRYGPHGFDMDNTGWYKDYQKKYWPMDNDLHSDQWSAIDFIRSGFDEPISRSSYLYNNGQAYRRNAYTKPSLMLTELKYILEDSVYYAAMQHYYDKWKLKHVNELRFTEAMEEFTGQELDWFFDPWLHTVRRLDYGIDSYKKSRNNDGFWTIDLGIKNHGTRFLPQLVETKFADGTVDRRWWKNHLWRYEDVFTYTVDKKPVSVTLDPDVQTVDLDYRNNTTGMMNKQILFDWPGLWYNPRDQYVLSWMPTFYYHQETSGFSPGITLDWDYGPYQSTTFRLNYAEKSNDLFWYINGWREPVQIFPRTTFHFWAFQRPGVSEYGGEIEKHWNRVYGRTPTHTFALGFYVQPDYDSTRATPLGFDTDGKLGIGYLNYQTSRGPVHLNLNGASTLGDLSTWSFNRLTATGTFSAKKGRFKFNQRIIAGKIWTGETGVPGQEGYNIEGNSSGDLLRKNYLVDQFYGQDTLFAHYHMPGEGNLRGFIGKGIRGSEALATITSEVSISKNIPKVDINIELAGFADAGLFWDRFDEDSKRIEKRFKQRTLADAGFGLRFRRSILEKDFYLRIDVPYLRFIDGNSTSDFQNWVFSFQRSI